MSNLKSNVFKFVSAADMQTNTLVTTDGAKLIYPNSDSSGVTTTETVVRINVNASESHEQLMDDLKVLEVNAQLFTDTTNLYKNNSELRYLKKWLYENQATLNVQSIKNELIAQGINIRDYSSDATRRYKYWDSLANAILQHKYAELRAELIDSVKIVELLILVDTQPGSIPNTTAIVAFLKKRLSFPQLFTQIAKPTYTAPSTPLEDNTEQEALNTKIKDLKSAYKEIKDVWDRQSHQKTIKDEEINKFIRAYYKDLEIERKAARPIPADVPADLQAKLDVAFSGADLIGYDSYNGAITGDNVTNDVSQETIDTIGLYNYQVEQTPTITILNILEAEVQASENELYSILYNNATQDTVNFIGGYAMEYSYSSDDSTEEASDFFSNIEGTIEPIGVGDLLVVEQRILKYEAGELAHIENIMAREINERTFRKLDKTENRFYSETEQTNSKERDHESTERFSLEKEASNIIQSDSQMQQGINVSASYGPVSLSGFSNSGSSGFSSESNFSASTFAKDITDRASETITKRTREEKLQILISEVEETSVHGIDNSAGIEHVVGMYQWVDKISEAQLMNYGKRMMFELHVPEPAAFYIHSKTKDQTYGNVIKKPIHPSELPVPILSAADIQPTNYQAISAQYTARDIDAPPATYHRIAKAYAADEVFDTNKSFSANDLLVPEGYVARHASVAILSSPTDTGYVSFHYGRNWAATGSDYEDVTDMIINDLNDVIPISGYYVNSMYSINIEVTCEVTNTNLSKWRNKTYTAILAAYQVQLAAFEQELQLRSLSKGVEIKGQNPLINRVREQEELKRACVEMMMHNGFGTFGALETNENGDYPVIDKERAMIEGKIMQFFENAFEWDQLIYEFLPYFWGKQGRWSLLHNYADPDPLFEKFLQAGSCKVVLPVKPEFTKAVLHYIENDEIPVDGTTISYEGNELNDEIIFQMDNYIANPTAVTPVGDAWEIRIPTSLIKLDGDTNPSLPDYTTP